MYLPQWAAADLAVFHAASIPDSGVQVSDPALLHSDKFAFLTLNDSGIESFIGTDNVKDGAVAKLLAHYTRGDRVAWHVKSSSHGYLIKVIDVDLCLTSKTKKVKDDDGEEYVEGDAGDITLRKCPTDSTDEEDPTVGGYWRIEILVTKSECSLRERYSYSQLSIVHHTKNLTITGALDNKDDEIKHFTTYPKL